MAKFEHMQTMLHNSTVTLVFRNDKIEMLLAWATNTK